jgi:hypothetical protein
MNFLKTFLFLIIFIEITFCTTQILIEDIEHEDSFAQIEKAASLAEDLYNNKHTNFFSDKYYDEVNNKEVLKDVALLASNSRQSIVAANKLNAIMNNVVDGEEKLKNNLAVKAALKGVLNNPLLKPKTRVAAAKLASRLTNLPVSLQTTEPNTNEKAKDLSSYIIMPNKGRIFRPDKFAENVKAGNWGLNNI